MIWLVYVTVAVIAVACGWFYFVRSVTKHFGRRTKEAKMNTRWYSTLYENHEDAIISVDHNFRIIRVNQSAGRLLGIDLEPYEGRPVEAIVAAVHKDDQEMLRDYFMRAYCGEAASFETKAVHEDKRIRDLHIYCMPFKIDEQTTGSHFVLRDITEENEYIDQMKQLAFIDELTGLSNRRRFYEVLEQAISQSRHEERPFAVLLMDLDGFKTINDSVGHFAGDRCLQQVSKMLSDAAKPYGAELARLGGDEFVAVLKDEDIWTTSATFAKRILSLLEAPMIEKGEQYHISISIGIAIYPEHKLDVAELLKAADEAMYDVKSSGKNNFKFYKERNTADVKKDVYIAQNRASKEMAAAKQQYGNGVFAISDLERLLNDDSAGK